MHNLNISVLGEPSRSVVFQRLFDKFDLNVLQVKQCNILIIYGIAFRL